MKEDIDTNLPKPEYIKAIGFLAYPDMMDMLQNELKSRFALEEKPSKVFGDICIYEDESVLQKFTDKYPYWAKTVLINPFMLSFASIGECAKVLKQIQRNWAPYQYTQFRRASLIQEKLPYINLKIKTFPFTIPNSPIGIYTLIDQNTVIASAQTNSTLPAGNLELIEDHENPPSRAYLKLQEALIRFSSYFGVAMPDENSVCFDAGACPGGWTWVLRQLKSSVFSVDRAELAESLMNDPKVKFLKHDAFTLKCQDLGNFDWVFSDVICYPERLYEWVTNYLASGMTKNMICTIKMQGEIQWEIVKKFEEIPNSYICHLNYNKHELTWMHHSE